VERPQIAVLFLDKLRLSKPWKYKAPFLISIPYFMVWLGNMSPHDTAWSILMSCITIFGIAGFGYFINDWMDREEDQKAGKFNVLLGMHSAAVAGLLVMFLALAVLPWVFYFPKNAWTLSLLGAELLLFILYSVPPFRFKERGILGVLCDALYAHAVPAILAAVTFYELAEADHPHWILYLVVLGGWQFLLGLRNILLHMRGDLEKDIGTGTRTLAVKWGRDKLNFWLKTIVFPLELLGMLGFYALMCFWWPWWVIMAVYLPCFLWYQMQYIHQVALPKGFTRRITLWVDDPVVLWFPLMVLGNLAVRDPWMWILIGVHLVLFRNALVESVKAWRGWVGTQRMKFLWGILPLLIALASWWWISGKVVLW